MFFAQQTNLFPEFPTSTIPTPQAMAVVVGNVLRIPLPKFHYGNNVVTHVGQLAKMCMTNNENTYKWIPIVSYHIMMEKCELVYSL
jgi:hypothetical protein